MTFQKITGRRITLFDGKLKTISKTSMALL
jgi:hypothetical protein